MTKELKISLDINKKLSETYLDYKRDTGEDLSYEEFIKSLQKTIFLWLRDILEVKLDLPNKFVAFRNDITNHNDNDKDRYIAGRFYFKVDHDDHKIFLTNKYKVTHIYWTKIGAVSDRDVSVLSFIETVGHEMAHYYYMVRFKRLGGDEHGTVFKMILSLWNRILSDKGYGYIRLSVFGHSSLAIINPGELSKRK